MISEAGSETVIVRNPNNKIQDDHDESCADNELEEADAGANFIPETKPANQLEISGQMAKITASEICHDSPNPGSKKQTL